MAQTRLSGAEAGLRIIPAQARCQVAGKLRIFDAWSMFAQGWNYSICHAARQSVGADAKSDAVYLSRRLIIR